MSGTDVEPRQDLRRPAAAIARRSLRRALLDLVFPPTCVSCHAGLDAEHAPCAHVPLCRTCLGELALFAGPTCRQCGAPVADGRGPVDRCPRCGRRKLWFDETIALGRYVGRLRQLLLEMKQWRGDPTSLAVADLAWHRCGERLRAAGPDLVVPIPIYWMRRWSRGTNSAALLAERLASRLGVPLAARVLRRRRNTPPQFTLPPSRRWPNVRRAFSVKKGYPLERAHVLLVDDILTTGATCSEAARALKRAGAARVTVVVAARSLIAQPTGSGVAQAFAAGRPSAG